MTVREPLREDLLAALLTPARRAAGLWVPEVTLRDVLSMASGRMSFVTLPWDRDRATEKASCAFAQQMQRRGRATIHRAFDAGSRPAEVPSWAHDVWRTIGRHAVEAADIVIVPFADPAALADDALVAELDAAMAANKPVLWMGPDVPHGREGAA